ncbi:hypothetical protein UAY_00282 [Enterococcus moraviensis ATCC BAA-383]|uniref:Helicase ATP-binding domain-containing protein n=1 Tax=Enterococcus moraviensis ATCC BAA-383 TaxID=1158609 RepID=R2RD56_9ENTE|nr:DEAD/DEAH box helicase family protein [Enterococcus moraviensis]EOI06940.1 hypothetical protein UAY_00282 [Enterococcus moraviensis ATCC BAA-383]EOT65282.1 hypothetical protein I586_03016 [Enterococcus moraviensis ATCC BAA-383]OJG66830.1 hypothetical protein RV09_GL003299 [Enterococcus moraviensis]
MELRSFQKKIIDEIELYLKDTTIHVVAPPGAGKTVLGVEIIKKLDKQTLILVPSLVLKNQWLNYLRDNFGVEHVSQRLSDHKKITITTYQEFHLQGESIKRASYAFIILDEAHHLKRTWAEEIISFREENQAIQSLSLTATPPYDATTIEWKRYLALNGAIDIDIPAPELIKEDVLVPYQDYVYLIPESQENEEAFFDFLQQQNEIVYAMMNDAEVTEYLLGLAFIQYPLENESFIYENFDTYLSVLLYLYDQDFELSNEHWEVLGIKNYKRKVRLPQQTKENIKTLYRFLYELNPNLSIFEYLTQNKWLFQNKLSLFPAYKDNKKYRSIPLKKESIAKILIKEEAFLGENLCSVVFMDRIKIETLFGQESYLEFGVAPLFLYLKELINPTTNLAVICGKFCLLSNSVALKLFPELHFSELEMDPNYSFISLTDENRNQILTGVTQALNQKKINLLIGTVSFLGEGWDCPALNTVILANTSGSYVQTQQLRGRGLRKSPEKSFVNIWHIATVYKTIALEEQLEFQYIAKRLSFIEGFNKLESVAKISTGIERFELPLKITEESINSYNANNFFLAQRRDALKEDWHKAISKGTHQSMPLIMKPLKNKEYRINDLKENHSPVKKNFYDSIFNSLFFRNFRIRRSWKKYCTQLERLINGVFLLLMEDGVISKESRLRIQKEDTLFSCKLDNASFNANTLFNQYVLEVMEDIDKPRYLLKLNRIYFSVPSYFSKNKKDVLRLVDSLNGLSKKQSIYYTKNSQGRKALIEAYIQQNSREVIEEKIWD